MNLDSVEWPVVDSTMPIDHSGLMIMIYALFEEVEED